jgi:hypothetical protein
MCWFIFLAQLEVRLFTIATLLKDEKHDIHNHAFRSLLLLPNDVLPKQCFKRFAENNVAYYRKVKRLQKPALQNRGVEQDQSRRRQAFTRDIQAVKRVQRL